MKFTETLCDLGGAVPSVLSDIVSHGAGASALECIRKLACKGMRDTLADPPPVLLHPSKLAFTNLLYGARKPSPLRDGPYFSVSDKAFCEGALAGVCVGGLCIDVTADKCCSAVVFARPNEAERRLDIVIHVYSAPLASMEAELFSGVGAPSAFEREWLAERAPVDKGMRAQAGQYVRTRGFDEAPQWLHTDKYAVERPGALVLLRARLPATEVEKDDLRATLERETLPSGGASSLKDLLHQFAPAGLRVTMRTVFYARPLSDKPERAPAEPAPSTEDDSAPEGIEGCTGATEFSVIGPLSLLVLKHITSEDFYGVDAGEAEDKGWEAPAEEATEEAEEAEALQGALDHADTQADKYEPCTTGVDAAHTPMRLLAATLRPCDVKLVVRSNVTAEVARAFATTFFSDWGLTVDTVLKPLECDSVRTAISRAVSIIGPRHAVLLVEKSVDGRVGACSLLASNGCWDVPRESIARYVLFPWVTPLIFDGTALSEIQVHATTREALRVPVPRRPPTAPPAEAVDAPTGPVDVEAAAPGLGAVVAELRQMVTDLKEAALKPALPVEPRVETELTRSLKRTIAHLEACEA